MADQPDVIKCPFCGHKEMEKIYIGMGRPTGWWKPGDFLSQVWIMALGKIDAYRCERCHYVMMFARD